jgi:peptidoglycan/LPS O-acetylase OafA/YrhL
MSEMTYRRDIDGLRAVAVSAVVLYHAGVMPRGGYIGVDVFFVISGYLITALLLKEHVRSGRIDLIAFYARRVRRILPAAFTVIVTTLGLSYFFLSPSATALAAHSAAAASVFVANIYFQLTTGGYFDPSPDGMPLLHLWSLSVEEQFYVLWPALLIVLLRYRVRLVPALAGLALASFALCEWLMSFAPTAAFFETPARFWELAVGGLVAVMPKRSWPGWTTWAALAITLAACFLPIDHFPGYGALPAVAGAAFLLAAIHGGATNVVLTSRPLVGIGLVSYSLYLWHWPLLVLYRVSNPDGTTGIRLLLCGMAVLLAIASYRYIETPFRRPGNNRGTVIAGCGIAVVLACGSALAFVPPSTPALTRAQAVAADRPSEQICNYDEMAPVTDFPMASCNPARPGVVLWGDSLALAWQPFARKIAADARTQPIGFTRVACPPISGMTLKIAIVSFRKAYCSDFNQHVSDWIVSHGTDTVVIAAHWLEYRKNDDLEARLVASLERIAPHVRRILVFGPTPELPRSVPDCVETGGPCSISRHDFEAMTANPRAMMARIAKLPKVEIIDPTNFLCSDTECPGVRNGIALYYDNLHISSTAAARFAAQWK